MLESVEKFSRIQNLHISQTVTVTLNTKQEFSRIQNLHISQTKEVFATKVECLVEFKIYISLKLVILILFFVNSLVEFKIYISLKQLLLF